jgi:hypothetical protein
MGLTFPIATFLELIAKRAVNLCELGLTFEYRIKPVRLELLFEACSKFQKLVLHFNVNSNDSIMQLNEYVNLQTRSALEKLRHLEINVRKGFNPYCIDKN